MGNLFEEQAMQFLSLSRCLQCRLGPLKGFMDPTEPRFLPWPVPVPPLSAPESKGGGLQLWSRYWYWVTHCSGESIGLP